MKNFKAVFALVVLLGSTGIASADQFCYAQPAPQVSASVYLPGFHLVLGHPRIYGWYQGRYYNRAAWNRFYRLHRWDRDRFGYGYGRNWDRDRYAYGYNRGHDREDLQGSDRNRDDSRRFDGDHNQDNGRHFDDDQNLDFHRN